jgi:hypothetical protein
MRPIIPTAAGEGASTRHLRPRHPTSGEGATRRSAWHCAEILNRLRQLCAYERARGQGSIGSGEVVGGLGLSYYDIRVAGCAREEVRVVEVVALPFVICVAESVD